MWDIHLNLYNSATVVVLLHHPDSNRMPYHMHMEAFLYNNGVVVEVVYYCIG